MPSKFGTFDFGSLSLDCDRPQVSDRLVMETICGVVNEKGQQLSLEEAGQELFFRIRDLGLWRINRWCHKERFYDEMFDVLEISWVKCVQKAGDWLLADGHLFEDFVLTNVNAAIQSVARARKRTAMETQDRYDDNQLLPDELAATSELVTTVRHEIQQLPELQRECISLRIYEGYRYEDIVQALQISLDGARKAVDKAFRRLKMRLKAKGFAPPESLGMLIVLCATPEIVEARFSRLIAAAPMIASGGAIPPGVMTPAAESLFFGTVAKSAKASSWLSLMAMGCGGLAVPAACALAIWWPTRNDAALTASVEQISDNVIAETLSVANDDALRPSPTPGPTPGQIRSVFFEPLGISIDFCWIPGDKGNLPGFWMARTELTQAQWKATKFVIKDVTDTANPSGFIGDDLPLEGISAEEAAAFIDYLRTISNVPVRLPTQAEWNFAAAAGNTSTFVSVSSEEVDRIAWLDENSGMATHPVGTKASNLYNLHDIFGNVFEVVTDADGGHSICGGCWCYDQSWCVPDRASKWNNQPRQTGVGLRLALSEQ
jgi:DNA-directed RNA polymerase specialized sigma24 family protein